MRRSRWSFFIFDLFGLHEMLKLSSEIFYVSLTLDGLSLVLVDFANEAIFLIFPFLSLSLELVLVALYGLLKFFVLLS